MIKFVSVVNMLCSVRWFTSVGTCPAFQGLGFRVQGAGFRVQGSGFRVQGAGIRVQGSGFRVQGSGTCSVKWCTSEGTCVWVRGLGFEAWGLVFEG